MWENLLRVNWAKLTHAYGPARNVPDILRDMIAADQKRSEAGWRGWWGSLNHQGDYYDSTVAAIPFLVEAVEHTDVNSRLNILNALRDLWLQAPSHGGDPLVQETPKGIYEPTPMLSDAEFGAIASRANRPDERTDSFTSAEDAISETESARDFDVKLARRMGLFAWQTARAVQTGQATFERLLIDPDRQVAAAAAALLMLWPHTRAIAKQALVRMIGEERDSIRQAGYVLEFGVCAVPDDVPKFAEWVSVERPLETRVASGLCWAWVINPAPLPEPAATALTAASAPDSLAFANLPRVGVYGHGAYSLPANAAHVILRLAESRDKELRWRSVQACGLACATGKNLDAVQVVPLLFRRLSDDYNRIREAAASALSERGETILDIDPEAVPKLLAALEPHESAAWGSHEALDCESSSCGNVAQLLYSISHRLDPAERKQALEGFERAAQRYAGSKDQVVRLHNAWVQASRIFEDMRDLLVKVGEPVEMTVLELFMEVAFLKKAVKRLSPEECDRRLADAYARSPRQTIAAAVQALADVGKPGGRAAACGARDWLMTLGPAAEPALHALDALACADIAPIERGRARSVSKYIRSTLLVDQNKALGLDPSAPLVELVEWLTYPHPEARTMSAERLVSVAHVPQALGANPAIENLLADEASLMVGVSGEFECEGRLYHWRLERRSPRAAAVRALFAMAYVPTDNRMFKAMLGEAAHPTTICGEKAIPCRFPISQWRTAIVGAGGMAVCEVLIRTAQQRCEAQPWPGNNGPYVCASELAKVIRVLAGRLVE
jgi:hypothetical protein